MDVISVNPANGEKLKRYKSHSDKQISQKIGQTHEAWLNWKNSLFNERSHLLTQMAKVLSDQKRTLAALWRWKWACLAYTNL